jgi:cobalamin synthase
MVLTAYGFSPARVSGSAVYFREGLGLAQTLTATAITIFAALVGSIFIGWEIVSLLLIGPLGVWLIGGWASRRLGGGLTGYVYGAICEITEGLCLILIALRN